MTNGSRHMEEFKAWVDRVVPGTIRREEPGFSLENGPAQLAPWFDDVHLERYPDALVVTEAEPLVAYVRSYVAGLDEHQEEAMKQQIQVELDRHGTFHITKDPGMISGVKRHGSCTLE